MVPKIIVIDDDPTGSQTVHSCLLLLRWDVETLRQGLRHPAPIFFILANTRSMVEAEAIATVREICHHLKTALALEQIEHYLLVSRSDSTLRGHFPAETEAIAAEFGEFDACFHAPAFFEGGRITLEGTHYIRDHDQLTPVHTTEFAQDRVFGFQHSFLPAYIEEKTQGAIAASSVQILDQTLSDTALQQYLLQLQHNQQVVLNATHQSDFDRLTPLLYHAANQGKKFLFRSAASLLTSLAHLDPPPPFNLHKSDRPGIIFVGSHVRKTTDQLTALLQLDTVQGIEIDVHRCQQDGDRQLLIADITPQIHQAFQQQQTPVLYTSRTFHSQANLNQQITFGNHISRFFQEIVTDLPPNLSFIISKGGNTTNLLLSQGLKLQKVNLLGQITAGCCLVQTPSHHPQCPQLPIVLFPGNVGDRQTLKTLYQQLQFPPQQSQ